MHFQPLSPSPFPRKQGKGSDLPLPAGGERRQGGVNAPHMALRASHCAERVKFITRSREGMIWQVVLPLPLALLGEGAGG